MTMLRAKRTIEAMLANGEAVVGVPTVENLSALAIELRKAGVKAARIVTGPIDVRALRLKLAMT